jgi:hypothetical protein
MGKMYGGPSKGMKGSKSTKKGFVDTPASMVSKKGFKK